jgi:hypothetical protein
MNEEQAKSLEAMSEDMKAILEAAAEKGEVLILSSDQTGKWIAAGAKDFLFQDNPALTARYYDAFLGLIRRGVLRHDEGNVYVFSSLGFNLARKLRDRVAV